VALSNRESGFLFLREGRVYGFKSENDSEEGTETMGKTERVYLD
jgi:hypothetical protein